MGKDVGQREVCENQILITLPPAAQI